MAPTWTYAWIIAGMHDMGLNAQQADIVVAAAVEIEVKEVPKHAYMRQLLQLLELEARTWERKKIIFRNLRG